MSLLICFNAQKKRFNVRFCYNACLIVKSVCFINFFCSRSVIWTYAFPTIIISCVVVSQQMCCFWLFFHCVFQFLMQPQSSHFAPFCSVLMAPSPVFITCCVALTEAGRGWQSHVQGVEAGTFRHAQQREDAHISFPLIFFNAKKEVSGKVLWQGLLNCWSVCFVKPFLVQLVSSQSMHFQPY